MASASRPASCRRTTRATRRAFACTADAIAPLRRFSHDLNAYLSWDSGEIAALLEPEGEPKFARYLAALGEKIAAWQEPREIDFSSRSQAQNTVVIGGLDFES